MLLYIEVIFIQEKNSIKAINKFLDTWETFDKSPDVRLPQNQWISLTKNFGIPTDLRVISGSTEIIEVCSSIAF